MSNVTETMYKYVQMETYQEPPYTHMILIRKHFILSDQLKIRLYICMLVKN